MTKISFVYFDVGGVLVQDFSDSPKWDTMKQSLGVKPIDEVAFDSEFDRLDTLACLGRHIDSFIPELQSKFNLTLTANFSLLDYFITHFEPNLGLWSIISKLKEKVKIGLLTDMYLGMLDAITSHKLLPPAKWSVVVDSSLIGFRKPAPEIYQIAMDRAGVPANEILFIDNREKNLVVPRELGWQTFLYDSRDYKNATQSLAEFLSI